MIIPTGIWLPDPIILDKISETKSKIEPINREPGILNLWFCVNNIFEICGEISPTNPIIPRFATTKAVIRDDKSKDINLKASTFTPDDFAISSPNNIALYSFLLIIKKTKDIRVIIAINKSIL